MSDSYGKRILVTGAAGFIGSHATELLLSSGYEVTALCHYNNSQSHGWLDNAYRTKQSHLRIVMSDINDVESMLKIVGEHEIVIHFAALIAIPYSYVAPRSYINTNVIGTFNILEAVRRHENRLVNISTSEVYGTPEKLPITEESKIKPQSPYAASKVASDAICNSYIDSFNLDATIIRPFNTYGPRQSQRAVIPTILTQALSGQKEIILGNLKARRDFTYVSDTVNAIKLAAESDSLRGKTIQLGTGRTVSVEDLIHIVNSSLGLNIEAKTDSSRLRPEASEVEVLQSDPALAKSLMGWEARIELEDGIYKTYEWLKDNIRLFSNVDKYII